MVTKFEVLPNEILIQCFEHLNALDLFYSFDQLNYRFNYIIRHIPLYVNLEGDINKSIFDQFCNKTLLNPQIKDEVYALNLPSFKDNNPEGLRTKLFLSIFLLEEFVNVQKLKTNADVNLIPMGTQSSHFSSKSTLEFSITSFHKLRALYISALDERSMSFENINLSITNLTLQSCDLNSFHYLSKHVPMLKYLHINQFHGSKDLSNKNTKQSCLYLKQLSIDYFGYSFDDFETLMQFTPNLKILTISAYDRDMIDAIKWERLITSSLPCLDILQFEFKCWYPRGTQNIINKLEEFQTNFWQTQHNWFIEYALIYDSVLIYTIPYVVNTYEVTSNYKIYRNNLKNNVNTFVNVTNLKLNYEILTDNYEDYFPNVTYLELDRKSASLTNQQIEYLGKIVNMFHLKHLDISQVYFTNSSVLIKLFERMPQLSVLSVASDQLSKIFNNDELCKYLNQIVKRLHIKGNYSLFDKDPFKRKEFYETFSKIEHLTFEYSRIEELSFSPSRLPKLSTVKAKWDTQYYPEHYLSQVENEVQELNVIYDINVNQDYYTDLDCFGYENDSRRYGFSDRNYDRKKKPKTIRFDIEICMWFGNKMS